MSLGERHVDTRGGVEGELALGLVVRVLETAVISLVGVVSLLGRHAVTTIAREGWLLAGAE